MSARTYALLPSDEPPGYRVETLPGDRAIVAFQPPPPMPLSSHSTARFCEMPPIVTINVTEYGREERLTPRERRQRARAKGRRRAVSVPVETWWRARVAAHPDVPARVVRAFIEEAAEVVRKVWDRRALRR